MGGLPGMKVEQSTSRSSFRSSVWIVATNSPFSIGIGAARETSVSFCRARIQANSVMMESCEV